MASFGLYRILSFLLLLAYVRAASSSSSSSSNGQRRTTVRHGSGTGHNIRPTGTGTGTGGLFPTGSNTTWIGSSLSKSSQGFHTSSSSVSRDISSDISSSRDSSSKSSVISSSVSGNSGSFSSSASSSPSSSLISSGSISTSSRSIVTTATATSSAIIGSSSVTSSSFSRGSGISVRPTNSANSTSIQPISGASSTSSANGISTISSGSSSHSSTSSGHDNGSISSSLSRSSAASVKPSNSANSTSVHSTSGDSSGSSSSSDISSSVSTSSKGSVSISDNSSGSVSTTATSKTASSDNGPTTTPPSSNGPSKPTSSPLSNSPASSTSSPLTSFTVFPSSASISTLTGSPTQGHIEMTASNGGVVAIPVLHDCFFCPPGGGFFGLLGFIKPGIYPAGGPPPGFPTPFPEITIGPDGNPTFSDEPADKPTDKPTDGPSATNSDRSTITSAPTSSTSEVCTTGTVTDCSTSLSYGVSDGKTTTTATITSCTPRVGCSLTASDVTSATTSSANGTCWRYSYDNDATNEGLSDDQDSVARRWGQGIAGRSALNSLKERGSSLYRRAPAAPVKPLKYTLGGKKTMCNLVFPQAAGTGAAKPTGTGNLQGQVTIPAYPEATKLEEDFGDKGASFWYVPTTGVSDGGCPTVTMTRFPNQAALTAQPVITDPAGRGNKYVIGGKIPPPGTPAVNVDHIYELSFLQSFFETVLGEGQISCEDFNKFFMAFDSKAGEDVPRYQVLWNQVPSNTNPDFAGMDQWINKVKGFLFNAGLVGLPNYTKKGKVNLDSDKIQLMNQMAAAINFVNEDDIAKLFSNANVRIYEAFLGIDALIAELETCKKSPPKPANADGKGWADVYSSYMENFIKTQNDAITSTLSVMVMSKYFSTFDNAQVTGGVKAFTEAYPPAKWTFDAAALLKWPTTSTLAIARRDALVCTLSFGPSGSASASVPASTTGSGSALTTGSAVASSSPSATATTANPTSHANSTAPATSTSPASSTSSASTSTGTLQCAPTSSPSVNVPVSAVQGYVQSFCETLTFGTGCVADKDLLLANSTNACQKGSPSDYINIDNTDVNGTSFDLALMIQLASGGQFAVNQTECNMAFSTIANCKEASGGSVLISDGNGDTANFSLSFSPQGSGAASLGPSSASPSPASKTSSPPPPPPPATTTAPPPSPAKPSTTYGVLSCEPTTGPGGPQATLLSFIDDFCGDYMQKSGDCLASDGNVIIGTTSSSACTGSSKQPQGSYGNIMSTVDPDDSDTTVEFSFNVTLTSGQQFAVNKTLCNSALGMALNGCNTHSLTKFGGSIVYSDGNGDAANFTLSRYFDITVTATGES